MMTLEEYNYEIILVNDGSPDNNWGAIYDIVDKDNDDRILGINFAKIFGQHAAIMAGLGRSTGNYVVCLDDDGQPPADEVDKLIKALEDGADVAYARYEYKQHSFFSNFGTFMNETMTTIMLGKPKELYISSYFATRKFVDDEMVKYESSYPYVIGLVHRTTKNIVNVDVNHRRREVGESEYSFTKLFAL